MLNYINSYCYKKATLLVHKNPRNLHFENLQITIFISSLIRLINLVELAEFCIRAASGKAQMQHILTLSAPAYFIV